MNLGMKQRMLESALSNNEAINHVTAIIAGLEHDLLEEVAEVQEAAGVETVDVPSRASRAEALESLVKAQVSGDLKGWYADYVLPQHLENPEKAKAHIGLDEEDWQEQKQTWADNYSEKVDGEVDPEQAAETYISNQFGVSVSEFEENVVNWDPGQVMQGALGGNHREAIDGLQDVREAIEEGDR